MDPADPTSFNLRDITLSTGRHYRICDQQPEGYVHGETPVLILLHGFPEFWYEWRNQIGPWVKHGWRVIAPDMLGYGGTDKPSDSKEYTALAIAGDIACLLDALELTKPVVVVGHDWGATAAWAFAVRFRERVRLLAIISIPYRAPAPQDQKVPDLVAMFPDLLGYWEFFTSPGAPQIIQSDIGRFIDTMYRSWKTRVDFWPLGAFEKFLNGTSELSGGTDILSDKERDFSIETLTKGGIDAPLNYFRSMDHRFEIEQALKLDPVLSKTTPILFVGTSEKFATDERIAATREYVPSMEVVRLTDCNHFAMVEQPKEVTQVIGDWIEKKLKEN